MWCWLWICLLLQGSEPRWVDAAGRPTPEATEALTLLAGSAKDGLEPEDYQARALREAAARLGPGAAPSAIQAFEAALDASVERFFHDVHTGRVDPRSVGFRVAPHAPEDFGARVRDARAAHRLTAAVEDLTPGIPPYRALRTALAVYRALASDTTITPPLLPRTSVHPGEPLEALPQLRRLLIAVGDLPPPPEASRGSDRYEGAIVDAVKRFQGRHGLVADGVLGATTRAALQVPLSERVRQIELAMERLRWLPDRDSDRLLAVNIPMFEVWAIEGSSPIFHSRVIVGRALNTRTPIFADRLEHVVFRPYWNVPPSIVRGEILPALARDPDYLRKHDMEYVGDGAARRIRQRPGSGNSLGLIKFAFPNDDNVYMHGTPAPQLFERERRDFSHGCIRVADPVGLAEWVLAREPGPWTRDRIVTAMNGRDSSTVTLGSAIPVVLFYLTALVSPADGSLHFAADIYGHDARLQRALRALPD